jgi:hypothetical protein
MIYESRWYHHMRRFDPVREALITFYISKVSHWLMSVSDIRKHLIQPHEEC